MDERQRIRVLFLCIANSCRSQMAEGFMRQLRPECEVHSAGLRPQSINPLAVKVMEEAGVDISYYSSKKIDQFAGEEFDYVVTLCSDAVQEICPTFPGKAKRFVHWDLPDPATASGSKQDVLKEFRKVRDEIKKMIEGFAQCLT